MECALHGGARTHHRPHQAFRHRIGRFRQANIGAQRAHYDRRERERDQDPARQHALRPALRTVNLAPISSATAVRPAPSSRCSRTCSSAGRPATTTGCSTSAAPSPEICSSCHPRRFWRPVTEDQPAVAEPPAAPAAAEPIAIHPIGARRFARHRFPQRRHTT